jgi:hypothetical protein
MLVRRLSIKRAGKGDLEPFRSTLGGGRSRFKVQSSKFKGGIWSLNVGFKQIYLVEKFFVFYDEQVHCMVVFTS